MAWIAFVLLIVELILLVKDAKGIMAQDDHNDDRTTPSTTAVYTEFLQTAGVEFERTPFEPHAHAVVALEDTDEVPTDPLDADIAADSTRIVTEDGAQDNEDPPKMETGTTSPPIQEEAPPIIPAEESDEAGFVTLEEFKEKMEGEIAELDNEDAYGIGGGISSSLEIHDSDGGQGSNSNYASLDAGATILDTSEGTKSATNLLVRDKDRYMLMPREKEKKWVVVSLSEDVSVLGRALR